MNPVRYCHIANTKQYSQVRYLQSATNTFPKKDSSCKSYDIYSPEGPWIFLSSLLYTKKSTLKLFSKNWMFVAVQCLRFSFSKELNHFSAAHVKVWLNSRDVRLYPNELSKTDTNNLSKESQLPWWTTENRYNSEISNQMCKKIIKNPRIIPRKKKDKIESRRSWCWGFVALTAN